MSSNRAIATQTNQMGQVSFALPSDGTPALPLTETGGPVRNMLNVLLTKNSRIRELESMVANQIKMNGAAGQSSVEVNQASVSKDLKQQAATAIVEKRQAFAERTCPKLMHDNHTKQVQVRMAQKDQELNNVKARLKDSCDQVHKDNSKVQDDMHRKHEASLSALHQQVEVLKNERDEANSHCAMLTKTAEEYRSRCEDLQNLYNDLYEKNRILNQTQLESLKEYREGMMSMQEEAKAQIKAACDELKAKHEIEVKKDTQLHHLKSSGQEKHIKDLEESLRRVIDDQATILKESLKQQNEHFVAQVNYMKAEHERLMEEKERELHEQIKEAEIKMDQAIKDNRHAKKQHVELLKRTEEKHLSLKRLCEESDTANKNLLRRLEVYELNLKTEQEAKTKIEAAHHELKTKIKAALETSPLTEVDLSNTRGVAAAAPKRLGGLASEAAASSATKRKSKTENSSSKKRVCSEPIVSHCNNVKAEGLE